MEQEQEDSDSDVCFLEERPAKRIHKDLTVDKKRSNDVVAVRSQGDPTRVASVPSGVVAPTLDHFDFISTIGKGGFGRVFLVRPKSDNPLALDDKSYFALKTIKKSRLQKNK